MPSSVKTYSLASNIGPVASNLGNSSEMCMLLSVQTYSVMDISMKHFGVVEGGRKVGGCGGGGGCNCPRNCVMHIFSRVNIYFSFECHPAHFSVMYGGFKVK